MILRDFLRPLRAASLRSIDEVAGGETGGTALANVGDLAPGEAGPRVAVGRICVR
jgi:hypothetical protein